MRFSADFLAATVKLRIYNENFAEEMEKSLEEKKEQFIEIVDLFEHGIDNDNIKVVVRYKDKDNIIFEKEFAN